MSVITSPRAKQEHTPVDTRIRLIEITIDERDPGRRSGLVLPRGRLVEVHQRALITPNPTISKGIAKDAPVIIPCRRRQSERPQLFGKTCPEISFQTIHHNAALTLAPDRGYHISSSMLASLRFIAEVSLTGRAGM